MGLVWFHRHLIQGIRLRQECLDEEKGKVHVLIEMFGRQTAMELDFTEVEVI